MVRHRSMERLIGTGPFVMAIRLIMLCGRWRSPLLATLLIIVVYIVQTRAGSGYQPSLLPGGLVKEVLASQLAETGKLSIGSTVFYDVNNNGLLDSAETGIAGVQVELYQVNSTLIASDVTDHNGHYLFDGLDAGDYYLMIREPPEEAPTNSTPTSTEDDGRDNDDNGQQPGGPGAPVNSPIIRLAVGSEPLDESGVGGENDDEHDSNGDMTVDFGFVPARTGVSIGDYVWRDNNQNGIQEPHEAGVGGIVIELFNAHTDKPARDLNGITLIETTDSEGKYLFENVLPGNYYLVYSELPVGSQITPQNRGNNDAIDSDGYENALLTASSGPLFDGMQNLTLDVGLYDRRATASVGNYVWYDFDADGIQGTNVNEYALANIAVTLFDADGSVVSSTQTDARGLYEFAGLNPGIYFIEYGLPNDFLIFVWPDEGTDDAIDSDANQSSGRTDAFVLEPDMNNSSLDAGMTLAASLITTFWFDTNEDGIRNSDEGPVVDGLVRLEDENGVERRTARTDHNGVAQFRVPPGNYRLQFVPPSGFNFTQQSVPGDVNSDAGVDGFTQSINLLPNETYTDLAAGIHEGGPTYLEGSEEPPLLSTRLYLPLTAQNKASK